MNIKGIIAICFGIFVVLLIASTGAFSVIIKGFTSAMGIYGLIFGVFNLSVMGGAAMGPLLTGYIFDVTNSYQMAFLLCTVISFTGILLAAFLKMMKR